MSPVALRLLRNILEERTGQQLGDGREWRVGTALQPVLRRHDLATLDALVLRLGAADVDPRFVDEVVDALLNNETFFFRDLTAFRQLTTNAVPRLASARAAEKHLRIWCAGCSTGQEAYSLAIGFAEDSARWGDWSIDIVGTDVSAAAIARAREGRYSQFEVQRGLPVRQMMRWFEPAGDDAWAAVPALRARVRFVRASLLDAVPPGRFDLILCRNVLLYFAPEMRARVFGRLAGACRDDGTLMLGAGETVLDQTDLFVSDCDARGLYRRAIRQPESAVAA